MESHLRLAARMPKVGHWSQLNVYRPSPEPAVVEFLDGFIGILLLLELDINIPGQVVPEVVAHVHLLHGPVLVLALHEDVFKEVVVMFLQGICI